MKRWTMYRCDQHGLLPRMQTRLGFNEPVGGRLECGLCDFPRATPAFVKEIEVIPLSEVREALLEIQGTCQEVAHDVEDPTLAVAEIEDRVRRALAAFPSDSEGGAAVKWSIERTYPAKSHRRPFDQPERWEGTGLIDFGERLEDVLEMSTESVAGGVGVLVEGVLLAAALRGSPTAASEMNWDGEDGRHVEARLEMQREPEEVRGA